MTTSYGEQHRRLQDQFDSRTIADVLAAVIIKPEIDDETKAFIETRSFFFLSTVDEDGQPTVSHKGGAAGLVRVIDPTTIVLPSYDCNGMFLSMGNIAGDGRIGMLFMDFEHPHRVRAHAHAVVSGDDPMMSHYPGADLIVRATVTDTFVNCPRYITPRTPGECRSTYPTPMATHRCPVGRRSTRFSRSSQHDSKESPKSENDVITGGEYDRRVRSGDA